jgi:RNA polymerase sigma factor (sigma-70 family)
VYRLIKVEDAVLKLPCDHQLENKMNHLHCHIYHRDKDYISEIQAGGSDADRAISCLYLKYRDETTDYISRLIRRNPVYKGVPEDLVQDSFIIMVDKIREHRFSIKSLGGYWIGIAKLLFLNQLKKDKRIIYVNEIEEYYGYEDLTPESILCEKEDDYKLENAFAQLGPKCKEVLMLWLNHYTMAEIAQKMNLSSDAMARKVKFECFRKLKTFLQSKSSITPKNTK